MMRNILIIAAMTLSFSCMAASVPKDLHRADPDECGMDEKQLKQVDRVINDAIDDQTIPGAVLSVVRNDTIVYLKAYGYKSLVPKKEKMTTETMFDLASVSKAVGTTLSFLQLVEDGKVRLIDNVSRYIPGFKPWVDPETGEKVQITIRDLLTHSSGLPPYIDVNEYVSEYGEHTPDSLESYIARRTSRNFRPSTDFTYSCLNFITLQRILERVTGMKLYEYAQKNVFDRLGLDHTTYFYLNEDNLSSSDKRRFERLDDLCAPTEVQADGKPLIAKVHDPIARRIMDGNSGNAGVFSNAKDLSVICAAIMNGGCLGDDEDDRILGPLTVRMMTRIPPQNDPSVGRALGWDKQSDYSGASGDIFNKKHTIQHTGYTGTSIVIDMKTKTAVILLTNRVHPEDKGSVNRLRALVSNIVASSVIE